jgi:hypothetical protein
LKALRVSSDNATLPSRLQEGFNRDRLPALNGFVQRLTAHRPTIKVKPTNRGNWLTGIKIDGYEPGAGQNGLALRTPGEGLDLSQALFLDER